MGKQFTADEVKEHNSADSCWVVLYGKVYDVTKFLPEHPGGSSVILRLAGRDATEEYDPVHPPGTLEENLPDSACLGTVDESTFPKQGLTSRDVKTASKGPVPVSHLLNIDEIEAAGTRQISRKAWAYYYSASDDLFTKSFNNSIYRDVLLRPRVFVDCTRCSLSTKMLGLAVDTPVFVSPAAMARLAHPSGEAGIAAACGKYGACQVISNNASMTPEQIVADAGDDQVFGWQMYVQVDRRKSERTLARINALRPKMRFVVLTLDAPVPGKREDDERQSMVAAALPVSSATQQDGDGGGGGNVKLGEASGGIGKDLFQGTAADLTWRDTLPWIAKHTDLPVVLKGIQTHEDAAIAAAHAPQVRAIVLSNHGGRAMDTAPPPLLTLLEIRKYCPWVLDRIEVWVDGGIKRGTDVVKALCLGAKAVGIGRPALFALGAGGPEGVERVFEILNGEIATAMRLLGVERIQDLGPQHVNARMAMQRIYDGPSTLPLDEKLLAKL